MGRLCGVAGAAGEGVGLARLISLTVFPLCFGIGLIEPKPLCVLEAFHAWAITNTP